MAMVTIEPVLLSDWVVHLRLSDMDMANRSLRICLCIVILLVFSVLSTATAADTDEGPRVVFCPIDDMVDDGLAVLVSRAVREAQGADALVLVVDTFGGKVDSAITITDALLNTPCRTIAYIRGKGAISAGAIISYACKEIVMHPASNIGGAQPVTVSPEGSLPTGEKEVSFLRSKIASLANVNGHNPALAQAMVDMDIELYVSEQPDGKVLVWSPTVANAEGLIPSIEAPSGEVPRHGLLAGKTDSSAKLFLGKGKLLTLTAQEALRFGLASHTADDEEQLLAHLGLSDASREYIVMTAAERIYRWLTHPVISGLLFMLGIGGLYLEMKTPGFGLPGVVGITALVLFFGARAVLGLAAWMDIILVATGLGLLLAEIFVIPGFGVAGILGMLFIFVGLLFSFTTGDFWIPTYSWEVDRYLEAGLTLLIASVSLAVVLTAIWKLLPRTSAYGHLVLSDAESPELGYVVQTAEDVRAALGSKGVAVTKLRPSGKGRFGKSVIQVVSQGEFIEAGAAIQIILVDGNRYIVKPLGDKT